MKRIITLLILALSFNLTANAQIKPITIKELNKQIQSSQKSTLVNLWATWCGPCVKEFPIFVELQKSKKDLSILLVSMDYDSQRADVEKFLKAQDVKFVTYVKSGSETEFIEGFLKEWKGALPVTVLYGPRGKVKKIWQEEVSKEELNKHLK